MVNLSVAIIVRNEEKNILRCLRSVKPVADEIVVVDSMSTDQTADICRSFGCRVFQRKFDGYGTQKQFAVNQATNDWILSLDADEVISEELINELKSIFPSPTYQLTNLPAYQLSAYRIPFSLHFMGRIMKHSGVGNEFHIRLFDRRKGGFTNAPVHEGIEVAGNIGKLKGRIIHYSYRDISRHLEKINIYTSQAAAGYMSKGKSFSRLWVALKFPFSFFSFYLVKGGFLDGYPGFMWSFMAAVYATLKVAKTVELNQNQ
ncbi:MAG: glycosyltransferase family 2 protein [Bacteroidetes bacterium]|nr:glycosyltransferase family 2 protein [Bacteroidota bacterium]